jgi:zona occludens toxin
MLTLITGQPGHGKTLYTLAHVEELRKKSGRTVFYDGIPDLTLPWEKLPDPKLWYELPDGSIIVIDEAYRIFPKRGAGAAVPKHVELVATHRHKGFDLFLVTQHAHNQIDHFVRGLVGTHFHVRRIFGQSKARLTKWERCANPDISFDHKDAIKSWFQYPKEVFGWYKSAEIHTHKASVPWKMVAGIVALVIALPTFFYLGFASLTGNAHDMAAKYQGESGQNVEAVDRQTASGGGAGLFGGAPAFTPESFIPTVAGIPYTAPAFAESAKPKSAPEISGCGVLKVGSTVTCKCNDQQGNTVDLDHRVCLAYFDRGSFKPSGKERYPEIEPYVPALAPPMGDSGTGGQADSMAADRPAREQDT